MLRGTVLFAADLTENYCKTTKKPKLTQKYSNYPYKIKVGRGSFLIINDVMIENRRQKYFKLSQ